MTDFSSNSMVLSYYKIFHPIGLLFGLVLVYGPNLTLLSDPKSTLSSKWSLGVSWAVGG